MSESGKKQLYNAEGVAINPWYREPWPWIIMGGLAVVVIACFVTLGFAIHSSDSLVVDDYYKEGQAINQTLERAKKSVELGLKAEVQIAPDGKVTVALSAKDPKVKLDEAGVQLSLIHSRYEKFDQHIKLAPSSGNSLTGQIAEKAVPTMGAWDVILENKDWRLAKRATAPFDKPVEIDAGA